MRNMKIFFILLALACMIMAVGCNKHVDEKGNVYTTEKTATGETKTTIQTKDGQTVTIQGSGGTEWCSPGSDWKMNAVGGTQDASATWKVIGPESGMCHVLYTLNTSGRTVKMDYWFSKDGKSGYYEMEQDGQKVRQAWNG